MILVGEYLCFCYSWLDMDISNADIEPTLWGSCVTWKFSPAMVGYFITLIVTKMLTGKFFWWILILSIFYKENFWLTYWYQKGLPIVILRPYALGRYFFQRMLQRKKYMTQRELDNVYCLEPVYYGWEYPSQVSGKMRIKCISNLCIYYCILSKVHMFIS